MVVLARVVVVMVVLVWNRMTKEEELEMVEEVLMKWWC